ncbi:DAMAGED DNA-BINDING 2 protein [Nymphaea thermarum]|nr:DAMAGED DNA-BINDING 2 protein [Nymphaea thermarum]
MVVSRRPRQQNFPKFLVERESDSEESTSGEEEEGDEDNDDDDGVGVTTPLFSRPRSSSRSSGSGLTAFEESRWASRRSKTALPPITISLKKVCKVCKGTGHEAGFRGATYIDCPKKPCFLCKQPGHTTISCPHRVAPEHALVPTPRRNSKRPLDYVFERQLRCNVPTIKPRFVIPNQVDCAIIRLHSRRVTCLEFHPTNNKILLSADKKGQLGIWDYNRVSEKTVYDSIHSCILNSMKFNPVNDGTLYTTSADGTISCTDLEIGIPNLLMDLNPSGWNGPANWRMLHGLDINSDKQLVLVTDNFGYIYMLDLRSNKTTGEPILIHKKGTKVVGLHCNPLQPDLLLSCGNDHFARIWDVRRLEAGSCIESLAHGRVVNSAYFSPLTGNKILTTSQDNRIRVWNSIFGNLERPSREIVHSHDFNRHLTCFRAEWDPKDPSESLAVIGRYISENYNGVALHPIDFIDISTGQLVAEVMEPSITTISSVNKLHPREDIMASGSSRSLYVWRPKGLQESDQAEAEGRGDLSSRISYCGKDEKGKKGKRSGDDDDDGGANDDEFPSKASGRTRSSYILKARGVNA